MLFSWWEMASNGMLFSVLALWATLAVIHASEEKSKTVAGPFMGLSYRDRMDKMESIKASFMAVSSPSPSPSGVASTVISPSHPSFVDIFFPRLNIVRVF